MAINTYLDRLNRWKVLSTNLKNHLDELPQLTEPQTEFEALIDQGLGMVVLQKQMTGEVRDLIARRNALLFQSGHLRELLVAALRQKFGPSSLRLLEFEIRPRGRRRQTPPADQPPGDMLAPPAPPEKEA